MADVKNNKAASRYELEVDGHLAVADYMRQDDRLLVTHVEVPEELRGQGIAAKVMDGVVADAQVSGLTIVPICSYAVAYMQRKNTK